VLEQKVLLNQMPIAIKDSKIDITFEKSTKELAENFAENLIGGEFIFIYGDMGVGKTTFAKYLINKIQKIKKIPLTEVTSPTYNLLNEYEVNDFKIKHYDLFRIKNISEAINLDIFEKDEKIITLVEWPQLVADFKKIKSIDLTFKYENEFSSRSVQIKSLK